MNKTLLYIINRAKEPSSWSGFGFLFLAMGVPAGTYQLISQAGMAIAGLLAVAIPESKTDDEAR